MINLCNMLYVTDVPKHSDFWTKIGLKELRRQGSGQEETVIFAVDPQAPSARIQLWNLDFIRTNSPEVANMKGSMLFTVDNLEEWHARVAAATDTVSEINNFQGMMNFNFQDPDGNYYAFAKSELPE
ncbi:VOC family protein [Lactococcus garvieae]|uniref:VOC family protein n=1 Tax=Lactococcus garvieae TaxID=1363 RepID=UPI0018D5CCA2|nr:VOC family protein [Lactococcus garvieae]QPS71868.1 VOC family protein [Lactococcus garvieae]